MFIRIPVLLAADTTTNGYVAVHRAADSTATGNTVGINDTIMPFSIFRMSDELMRGEVIFQTPHTGTFHTIYNARSFDDISGHWAASNITFLAARGLAMGVGNNNFAPNDPMTRAMFAQMLANIEGVDLSLFTTSRFNDVAVGAWYAPAVEWAASMGIVSGTGNGNFAPSRNITRQEMAVMLANYINFRGYTLPVGTAPAFADDASISSWAREAVTMMQLAGIVSGMGDGQFNPTGTANRAQVVAIFARFIETYVGYAVGLELPGVPNANPNHNPLTGRGGDSVIAAIREDEYELEAKEQDDDIEA